MDADLKAQIAVLNANMIHLREMLEATERHNAQRFDSMGRVTGDIKEKLDEMREQALVHEERVDAKVDTIIIKAEKRGQDIIEIKRKVTWMEPHVMTIANTKKGLSAGKKLAIWIAGAVAGAVALWKSGNEFAELIASLLK